MAATMIFMVLLCVSRWSWYFNRIWFLWIHHVPMHDWCTFRRDMFINSGNIAHWNMEKLPILYNGNFRCHGNVCYVFRINAFFCKLHRIGPSNMCVNFGMNRLNIDDFISRFPFFINQPYHIDNIQNSENWQMTLTFDLYLTLTLSLTFDLDDLKKYIFFNFFHFLWSHVTQNVTSYVKTDGRIQKWRSIRNICQPTRSLYHFRFKSYSPLCDFHWNY